MQRLQQHPWINLAELKGELIRKLGPDRSKQYFYYLNRFLSLKLNKAEFDRFCLRIVGKDNIKLHNQLILSILKNACTRKVLPPTHDNSSRIVGIKKPSDGVHHQNGASSPLALLNGDILPPSPRKARTHRTSLRANGKTNYASPLSSLENGNSSSIDTRRSMQHHHHHHHDLIQQLENGHGGERSSNGKEVSHRTSLDAPLGIPYCPSSIGGARRELHLASDSKCVYALDTEGLLNTITLKERMEQIAATQGIQGVSMDSANVVNSAVNAYLNGLIRSCVELNGARSAHEPHLRSLNGVKIKPGQSQVQDDESKRPVSLLDFRVAMELDPQQLGEDWPIMLEKICIRSFEE